jgi:hypothetical protein
VTTPHAAGGLRLFYIDDSGAQDTGYIVYSWIEVTPGCWNPGLRHWLDLRKEIYRDFQVGADEELHATVVYGGRKMPGSNPTKRQRKDLLERAVESIGANADIFTGTIYRHTEARGKEYATEKAEVYAALVAHLDQRLADAGEYGCIIMDGNGTDPMYHRAHRELKLATRRLIEDPFFQGSHLSQWVQMADLVAWTTYQWLLQHPGKMRPAGWYEKFLAERDVNGGPIEV